MRHQNAILFPGEPAYRLNAETQTFFDAVAATLAAFSCGEQVVSEVNRVVWLPCHPAPSFMAAGVLLIKTGEFVMFEAGYMLTQRSDDFSFRFAPPTAELSDALDRFPSWAKNVEVVVG